MANWSDETLLLAVVQREDASSLIADVNRRGHQATRINASGGFLSVGNVVVLMAVASDDVPDVLEAIQRTCQTRMAYVFQPLGDVVVDGGAYPIEVEVGGAVVFALPIERRVRISGRQPAAAARARISAQDSC